MKKPVIAMVILLIVVLILAFILFHSGRQTTPTGTLENAPSATAATVPSKTPEPTPEPVATPDPRNEEAVVREEIANMLRDAKELIDEGLSDDAGMILRDLRTRDLTVAEKEQVDALQASMVKISD